MASLLEIADVARTVPIRGKEVEVYGVSGEGLANLMVRFPEVGKMLSGANVDTEGMMKLAPAALAAFIAAGCGKPGDEKMEDVARKLGVAEQLDLVDEILRLTFPRGVGPFVLKLRELGVLATRGLPGAEAVEEALSQTPSPDSQKNS